MRSTLGMRWSLVMMLTLIMGLSVLITAPAAHASSTRPSAHNTSSTRPIYHSLQGVLPKGVHPNYSGEACNSDGTLDVCVFPYGGNVFTQAYVESYPCYNLYQFLDVVNDRGLDAVNSYNPGNCPWGAVYTLGTSNIAAGGGLVGWYAKGCYSVLSSGGPRYCVNSPTIWINSL